MPDLLRYMAEPSRRLLLNELRSGPRSVGGLVLATGLKQSNVSNHLAKLRANGVVTSQKTGRYVYYSLASPAVECAVNGYLAEAADPLGVCPELEEAAKTYAQSAIRGDEDACAKLIDTLLSHRVGFVGIYQNVLALAMEMIGRWYQVDAIDEGQEHLASSITERMMGRVFHFSNPVPGLAGTALLGCVAGNTHTIGLRMVSDFLKHGGWSTLFMGANVPRASFITAVKRHKPRLVLLSCAQDACIARAVELLSDLAELRRNTPFWVAVGGTAAPAHRTELLAAGADFIAANLTDLAAHIRSTPS